MNSIFSTQHNMQDEAYCEYTIVYDWNGTVIDDAAIAHHCVCLTLKKIECREISLEVFREHYDWPLENFYQGLGIPEKDISNIYTIHSDFYHGNYEPLADKAELRDGGAELFAYAHTKKIRQLVLSNHLVDPIRRQNDRFKISHIFKDILARKNRDVELVIIPKAEKLRLYMEELGLKPENTLIVGDSPEEPIISRQYGGPSIAITGGWVSEKRLVEAKPDYLVHSLSSIIPILSKMGFGS